MRKRRKHNFRKPAFYEFFAGGGMVRAGLGNAWECLFANDIAKKKAASYAHNWGGDVLKMADVTSLTTAELPGQPDLVWASFPCQDLSLAGNGAGLKGKRSSTFWPFWNLVKQLRQEGRMPAFIVIENVCGAVSSHDGRDFASIASAIAEQGCHFGAVVMDAVQFVPQSRPRLFIIAVREDMAIPVRLSQGEPSPRWHTRALIKTYNKLPDFAQSRWVWWAIPIPPRREIALADLVEDEPRGVRWNTAAETNRLLGLMDSVNLRKVQKAKRMGRPMVGTVYKRTRRATNGIKTQRAEIRFDGIAGCLRTPVGGSSRQLLLFVNDSGVKSRLLSPREASRLMGLADNYELPKNYNEAYHLAGDGVVVPVVRYLAEHLLEPVLSAVNCKVKGTG